MAGTRAHGIQDMVLLPGGVFLMGSGDDVPGAEGERPVHAVEVEPFWIDACTVSNADFATFADACGYVTDAERAGWSFVFAGLLRRGLGRTRSVAGARWWRQVSGADWRHPEGPGSTLAGRADHPVVHVSWRDAREYCATTGRRLPTEAEWEFAARGGAARDVYPWGDELERDGRHWMNVWQGRFPKENTLEDDYYATAPVDAFPPNGYGLHNVTGNVWEWTADWFDPGYYRSSPRVAPAGPERGTHRVIRGGSYLSQGSEGRRCSVATRGSGTPASSTGDVGFRCARDD